jgi:uncharacterized protein (DUF427 family)
MPRAIWEGELIAETDSYETVDGNVYFPMDSLTKEYFRDSNTHTTCGYKGVASYFSVEVNGKLNKDCAWYYPTPKSGYTHITNYVGFWKGVQVEK